MTQGLSLYSMATCLQYIKLWSLREDKDRTFLPDVGFLGTGSFFSFLYIHRSILSHVLLLAIWSGKAQIDVYYFYDGHTKDLIVMQHLFHTTRQLFTTVYADRSYERKGCKSWKEGEETRVGKCPTALSFLTLFYTALPFPVRLTSVWFWKFLSGAPDSKQHLVTQSFSSWSVISFRFWRRYVIFDMLRYT